ncbi:MAG: hypothetical protein LBC39_07710 [Methanobrevibacter sp.]|jgi:hypothetical protein|nr:hypothetical protein [Candidatus Methanovirga aequatorialis]
MVEFFNDLMDYFQATKSERGTFLDAFSGRKSHGRIRKRRFLFILFMWPLILIGILCYALYKLASSKDKDLIKETVSNSKKENKSINKVSKPDSSPDAMKKSFNTSKMSNKDNNLVQQAYNAVKASPHTVDDNLFERIKLLYGEFNIKFNKTKSLLDECFDKDSLTYQQYIVTVNDLSNLMVNKVKYMMNVFTLNPVYTAELIGEFEDNIALMNDINNLFDKVNIELLKVSYKDSSDVDFDELNILIDNIKEYKKVFKDG